jgi:hypothetical protein
MNPELMLYYYEFLPQKMEKRSEKKSPLNAKTGGKSFNSAEISGRGLHIAWKPRKNYNNIKERKR